MRTLLAVLLGLAACGDNLAAPQPDAGPPACAEVGCPGAYGQADGPVGCGEWGLPVLDCYCRPSRVVCEVTP